jgi:hypothetical protein
MGLLQNHSQELKQSPCETSVPASCAERMSVPYHKYTKDNRGKKEKGTKERFKGSTDSKVAQANTSNEIQLTQ